MNRAELIKTFYDQDPFTGFPIQSYTEDLQGWGGNHPAFAVLTHLYRPKLFIEVGSWKGMSSVFIGRAIKEAKLSCPLICVDTWLGAEEHFKGMGVRENGYPRLYFQFAANIIINGLADVVVPFPQTSHIAADMFSSKSIKADLVYIDASHHYRDVIVDLNLYWDLITDDGCLIGDDYHWGWPGVVQAAHEFATKVKRPLYIWESKYFIPKDDRQLPKDFIHVGREPYLFFDQVTRTYGPAPEEKKP
jgi:Methyltransferase domain